MNQADGMDYSNRKSVFVTGGTGLVPPSPMVM